GGGTEATSAPPYRLLDGAGHFTAPGSEAEAIVGDVTKVAVSAKHPPGLYGSEDGFRALNLLDENAELTPCDISAAGNATVRPYPTAAPTPIAPWLIALAVALLVIDALAVLWLNGGLRWRRPRAAATAAVALLAFAALAATGGQSRADEATDAFAAAALDK